MPNMDGFAATRLIRALQRERGVQRTPTIALTASAMVEERQKCLAAGMDDILARHFSRDDLARMLWRWSGRRL